MSDSAAMIAFAKARLDEDETRASAALPRWHDDQMEWEDLGDEVYSHARRHDPARVLREVEAKRAILAMRQEPEPERYLPTGEVVAQVAVSEAIDSVVRHLAAVYSDHPDYQQDWKP